MMDAFAVRTIVIDGRRIAYRATGTGPPLLCLHGYPTSSFLWRSLAPALAGARTIIAPDLPGFGDSDLGTSSGTWEEQVSFLESFVVSLDLASVDLVVHDWGGLIGLRWACDRSSRVDRLVITNTGFFPEGRWHGMAEIMRTPEAGESLMDGFTSEGFAGMMRLVCPSMPDPALAEYWKALATPERRAAKLALYRSGNFAKLEAYRGRLAALARPTLIVWGASDRFAPAGGAVRFAREIAGSRLVLLPGVGHFLHEEAPWRTVPLIREFLTTARTR